MDLLTAPGKRITILNLFPKVYGGIAIEIIQLSSRNHSKAVLRIAHEEHNKSNPLLLSSRTKRGIEDFSLRAW
jgi:hypothetical protein